MKNLNIYYFKAHWFLFIFSVTKTKASCRAVNLKNGNIGKNTQVPLLKFNEVKYLHESRTLKCISLLSRESTVLILKKNNISTEFMPVVESILFPQSQIF